MSVASSEPQKDLVKGILARAAQILISLLIIALALFIPAGRLDWVWAWVYLGISLVNILINSFLLRNRLDVVAERGRPKEMKDWDKFIGGFWGLAQFLGLPLVAGLDKRLGWSLDPGLAWHVIGALAYALGLALFSWAMISNAFFSTVVRIQDERGHAVCRSGPYRFVRHPGYSGAILQSLGIPLMLGSNWAFIPGIIAIAAMILRTSLEDRTLQAELAGYADFTHEVHYRLLPRVW